MLEHWEPGRLTEEADVVVEAVVGDSTGVSPDGRNIFTETRLSVRRYWKGHGAPAVIVTRLGGAYRDRGMWIPGNAELSQGAHVVMFLKRASGRLWIAGMAQGVFEVRDGIATRVVPVAVARDGILAAPHSADLSIPLTVLKRVVARAARGHR